MVCVIADVNPDDDLGKVLALEAWIRSTCVYAADGPSGEGIGAGASRDAVGEFLLVARRGHCEHFASALAVCCRIVGVPARLAAGFHANRWNDVGGFWLLRRRDAHAWVEAKFAGYGWVRFDATPADVRAEDPYEGVLGALARLADALSYEWTRHVVGYDSAARGETLDAIRAALAQAIAFAGRPACVSGGAVLALAVVLAAVARRGTGRRKRAARSAVRFYARILSRLRRVGYDRAVGETPTEFRRRVGPGLAAAAGQALAEATEAFERVKYAAGPPPPAPVLEGWLALLRRPGLLARGRLAAPPLGHPGPDWT